jgi:hypothetical protein
MADDDDDHVAGWQYLKKQQALKSGRRLQQSACDTNATRDAVNATLAKREADLANVYSWILTINHLDVSATAVFAPILDSLEVFTNLTLDFDDVSGP